MIEWVAGAKIIAELLGTSIALIQGGREILKLVNAARCSAVGYVYVVQEVDYSKKFKIGRADNTSDWLYKLGAKIPGRLEPILVIPADDTSALERKLRNLYASPRTDGNWFELTESQVIELRQLQVVVDLAAGTEFSPSLELDPKAFEQAKRLFEMLSNASKEEELCQEMVSTSDPPPDSDLKSVPVVNYRALPELNRRSGYLLVVRDAERQRYRIERTDEPAKYIDKTLGLASLDFGLEIVMAFESSRLKDIVTSLSILYPPNDETGWIELSPIQLQEIRNLASPDYIHRGVFLTPNSHWGLGNLTTENYGDYPNLDNPGGYVCIVKGVKPGKKYMIWRTRRPKRLAGDFRLALMLNNPHDAKTSPEPIQFRCIIKSDYVKPFQTFLKERYSEYRRRSDWFELDDAQLQEICNLGKP